MATSSRSAERFKYGICLNDECPMCKQKKVQQIPMRKDLVCQNPECGKPLRECPPPKKPGLPIGLIIGIIAFLLVGGLVGGVFWAYNSGLFDNFIGEPRPILIEELSINAQDFTLNVGEKKTLACSATPANNEETITWKSSDESIASVDAETGEVKAIKSGSVNIIAQTDLSGISKSVIVTVKEEEKPQPILIEELSINAQDFTLNVGEKKTLSCIATPADNEESITWKSSDEAIATVDAETGEVKAIKPGSANIMAQTDQSGLSKSVTVTVKEKEKPQQPIDSNNTSGRVNLSFGVYEGPRAHGQAHGFGGTIKVTRIYTIDLKKANGETVTVGPGDQIVSVKMENGRLRQGEIHFSDGTRKYISGL